MIELELEQQVVLIMDIGLEGMMVQILIQILNVLIMQMIQEQHQ